VIPLNLGKFFSPIRSAAADRPSVLGLLFPAGVFVLMVAAAFLLIIFIELLPHLACQFFILCCSNIHIVIGAAGKVVKA
jgi:hypothetical protein